MKMRELLMRLRDRRRSARIRPEALVAHYWTGGAPTPMEVRDISLHGAYIAARSKFYPGTLLNLILKNQAQADIHISVCAQVGRATDDGFCVSFVLRGARERGLLAR